jgi:hypothetical protein
MIEKSATRCLLVAETIFAIRTLRRHCALLALFTAHGTLAGSVGRSVASELRASAATT